MKSNVTPLTLIAGIRTRLSLLAFIIIFIASKSYSQPICNATFQFYASPHNPDSIHYAPSNANAASYLWTFGDGTSSTNHDPWHLYNHAGVYYTCLTIIDANGTACTWCDSVHVAAPPACNAHWQFYSNPHNPDSLHFYPNVTNATSYLWNFGDGTTSTNPDPWHLYPHAGAYFVCLTITNANGQTCYWCDSVHVAAPPACNAHWQYYTSTHNPDSLHFYPNVTNATSYLWNFGDGTTSTNPDPWHLYPHAGAYFVCLTITDANGQTCYWCDSVHVAAPPACNAHWQYYASTHNPDSLHFYPNVTNATSYLWNFGDGTTSTNPDPWHLYPHAGAYFVCLTITNVNGQTCTWCDSVHVAPSPTCNAHWQFYTNPHNPDSLHFYPNVTNAVSYLWNFGDGTTSTNPDPWHLYPHPGAYLVCLTITNANGTTCYWCDSIHVVHPPHVCNAHFSFYPNSHNPDSLHFYSNGTPAVSYQWTFGDGTSSTNHDPWHLYAQPGAYYVCLTTITAAGDTCTFCDSIHVVHPPHVCNAHFQFYHAPHNPDSMHFIPNGQPAVSYQWSFGDGSTSTNHDPWHLYASPGTYTVCLTVIDATGDTCTWCKIINIIHPPHICNAHFQAYHAPHNFDSLHFIPQGPPALSYQWSFGDGTTSNNHDPWHLYAQPGTYNVCLTVIDASGDTCTWCKNITIIHPPHVCNAHFQKYPSPHNPDSIHFFPNVTNAVSYLWTFGDGTTSTNHDPWHLYSQPGSYYVCLTIIESTGDTCTWCDSIHVNPPHICNAHFQFYPSPNNSDSIHFNPNMTTAISYFWKFGDGTVSTNHDPWHLYAHPGAYLVCLKIVAAPGDTCTWCDSIHVINQPPVCNAQFAHYAFPNNTDSVHYIPIFNGAAQYLWSFGDGTSSTNHDPWHNYAVSGLYFTCLTITTPNGMTCTWCDSVQARMPSPNTIDPQNQYNSDVRVFPNPVDGIASISVMNISDPVEFNIYNLTGVRTYQKEVPGNTIFEINTSEIPNGIYYYTMISNGHSVSQGRIVIMH